MTQWVPISELGTLWTKSATESTAYQGKMVQSLGGLMDDSVYKMDDSTLTISDTKISNLTAPPQGWTSV